MDLFGGLIEGGAVEVEGRVRADVLVLLAFPRVFLPLLHPRVVRARGKGPSCSSGDWVGGGGGVGV